MSSTLEQQDAFVRGGAVPSEFPLISVCIPTYNAGLFLKDAIGSVIDQNYPNLEIIVQDNRSTDGTWENLEFLASKYPCLSIFRNERNEGMVPNWNKAINHATGDYLILLNADDRLEKTFFSECLKAFAFSSADVVTTNHFFLRDGMKNRRFLPVRQGLYSDFFPTLMLFNPFPIVFALFRRSAVESLRINRNLFRPWAFWACDYDLLFRLALSGKKLFYLSHPLAVYRVHGANLSSAVPKINRHAALVALRYRNLLLRQSPLVFRFTLVRFVARVFRNKFKYGVFDKRLFIALVKALFSQAHQLTRGGVYVGYPSEKI